MSSPTASRCLLSGGPVKGPKNEQKSFTSTPPRYPPPMDSRPSPKTKIIAPPGPATDSPEMLGRLIDAGVNVFLLNMSHSQHDWVRRVVGDIRAAAKARQRFIDRKS